MIAVVATGSFLQEPPLQAVETAARWFVLHTKSRQEKALAQELSIQGIKHYLPLVRKTSYYGRHRVIVDQPLFSGYVFLHGTIEQAYDGARTKRVANIIRVADQERMDWELRNIHLALTKDAVLDPYPYLHVGVRVEVRSGPFRGLQGIVADRCSRGRLILQACALGQAVSLEIDGALLEPLD